MMATQLAVRCSHLVKNYGEGEGKISALSGANLDVRSGELMMLAGPSGCGKTTLLSIIAGILHQDSGTCEVYGYSLNQMTQADRLAFRAKNIGFVFQAFNLFPTLTAAENVAVPLIVGGMNRKEATIRGSDLLVYMGLKDRVTAFPANLSGGQQQRVAIARALIHNPRLIVCDEPTSALDGDTGYKIMDLLKKVAVDKDRALLVVTHDARIFKFADRIAEMEDGRIIKIIDSHKKAK